MRANAPNGTPILGTLELIPGRAEISSITRHADGTLEIEYEGSTKIFWDDQKTVMRDGKRVYLDENGDEWTEDQLVLIDEDDDENGVDDE